MMIIDGHAHACGSCHDINSIRNYLKDHNIDKIILCGGEPNSTKDYGYPMLSKVFHGEKLGYFFNKIICKVTGLHHLSDEIDGQNVLVQKYAETMPGQVYNAYWINPAEKDCLEKMQQFYEERGFVLIKMHQCWTNFDVGSKRCQEIFQWAAKMDIPVFIHLLSRKQVERFVQMANKYCKTKFIVAHMIGVEYMTIYLTNDRVYFDLSAPQLYSEKILRTALRKFGANRLILGSDTPYGKNNIELNLNRLEKLCLTKEELEGIKGSTIKRLLKM